MGSDERPYSREIARAEKSRLRCAVCATFTTSHQAERESPSSESETRECNADEAYCDSRSAGDNAWAAFERVTWDRQCGEPSEARQRRPPKMESDRFIIEV
jgi:hypothetical protein